MKKEDLRKLVYTNDVTTLLQDGMTKVLEGYTTLEEVLKLIELDNDDTKKGDKVGLKDAIDLSNMATATPEVKKVVPKPTPVTKPVVKTVTRPTQPVKPAPKPAQPDTEVVKDISSDIPDNLDDFDIDLDI